MSLDIKVFKRQTKFLVIWRILDHGHREEFWSAFLYKAMELKKDNSVRTYRTNTQYALQ